MNHNFVNESLRATAVPLLPESGEAGFPADLRFLRMCFRRLRARAEVVNPSDDGNGLAVFVLRKDWSLRPGWVREFRMHRAEQPFSSQIWMTNEVGHAADHVAHEKSTSEITDYLIELGLGDCPTAVFDSSSPQGELMFYPEGAEKFMKSEVYYLATPDQLQVHDACSVIQYVYELSLKSPQHQVNKVSTWASPTKWWVSQTAEAQIQSLIRVALGARHLGLRVESEGDVDTGRFDLRLGWFLLGDSLPRWDGVLELKVLKTYGENGGTHSWPDNLGALNKGLRQAHTYRDDSPADWSILCVFDHRKLADDDCFADIREAAEVRGVELRSWRVYNSVEAYREAVDAATSGAIKNN